MANLARKIMKIFGSNAGTNQRGVFGSLAAGSTAYSTDPETIQSLSQWEDGWFSAVMGNNSPAIQDMNALQFVFAYQLAYLFQKGIPEWNTDTEYYTGSFCQVGGIIYKSLQDANQGNAVTDVAYWQPYYDQNQLRIIAALCLRKITNGSAYTNTWSSICWSPSQERFVAVSTTGTGDRVAYSNDGVSWSKETSAANNNWSRVLWMESFGLFVAVSTTGTTTQRCMTSPNGIAWTIRNMATTDSWQDMAYSPELERAVAIGIDSANCINWSDDGINWVSDIAFISGSPRAIAWSPTLEIFLAVQLGANSDVATSPDGENWTVQSSTNLGFSNQGLCWSEGLGIFCGMKEGVSQISADGINWTSSSESLGTNVVRVIWIPELRAFISFGTSGGTNFSYDGLNWQNCITDESSSSMAWSPKLSLLAGTCTDNFNYSR